MKHRILIGYASAVAAAGVCTLAGVAMLPRFDIVNIAMVYVLAVVIIALSFSRGAAIACSILCVIAFDVVFVPPRGALTVHDVQYLLTFAIMLMLAVVISELTARGRRQLEAQAALALEAETQRVRSTLLASISHDIRTPLAVIAGASSSLVEAGERLPASERAALTQSIYTHAQQTSEVVAKILEMTRLESGAMVLNREWASITEIAGSVLARYAAALERHRVITELPSDLPLVRVDAALIEQALANLVDNAARHTPAGTLVRVRAVPAENEIVVSVEDRGPGIADADRERIFSKFHRGDASPAGGGLGLGLAITRAIVRLHGGRVWAEAVTGGGSAFRFSLPLEALPDAPPDASPARAAARADGLT